MAATIYAFQRTFAVIFLCLLSLMALAGCKKSEQQAGPPPEAEVVIVTVQPKTMPAIYSFVAQIQSSHQVDVTARVSGFLEKICYSEGWRVRKGQILFQIDKKPFLAQVAAEKAQVDIRESQLWTAQANYNRIKPLADLNAASKSDLDKAIGEVKSASAALHQAKANLDKAKLDLSYTTIVSPVDGDAGQSKMREGGYIAAGSSSAVLTYVAKLNPAWVEFSISQNEQAEVREEEKNGRLLPPKDKRFTIQLELPDGKRYPHAGVLNFADPSFTRETGTFLVRAEIPNPQSELRPGMFVKVYLIGEMRPNALAVPQRAVQQTADGHVVYIVNTKNQADVRPVIVGDWVEQDWVIKQGLKAGERVIVNGFMRLAPGMPVKVVSPEQKKAAKADKPAAGK